MTNNVSTRSILDAIGNTPLVELRRIEPPSSACIVVKLESANPTGSMKDRRARAPVATLIVDSGLRYLGTDVFQGRG
jgi:cysteine synthase A